MATIQPKKEAPSRVVASYWQYNSEGKKGLTPYIDLDRGPT